MKYLLCLFFISTSAIGACPSVSRTDNSANTVLTSTKYNADLNTVYSAVNGLSSFDGNCVVDETITLDKLDSAGTFAALFKAAKSGCKVYNNATGNVDFYVDSCMLGVGSNLVNKSTATYVTFPGCAGCDSAATGEFYAYAKSDSTGSTLNVLVLDDTPQSNGYSSEGHRVLGKFYYTGSTIATGSFFNWVETSFDYKIGNQQIIYPSPTTGEIWRAETGAASLTLAQIGNGVQYYYGDLGIRLNASDNSLIVPKGDYIVDVTVYDYNGAGNVDVGIFADSSCSSNFSLTSTLVDVTRSNSTVQNTNIATVQFILFSEYFTDNNNTNDKIYFCLRANAAAGNMALGPLKFTRTGD